MSTPRSRARRLRGALIGVCSALLTCAAHAAAGGALPSGPTLVLVALACAIVGAAVAAAAVDGQRLRLLVTTAGLTVAQLFGHLILMVPAHHGGLTWSMAAAHLIAALLLGAVITAVEHLYAVCLTVLCWLRLFAAASRRPTPSGRRIEPRDVFAQSVLRACGLGMRAPPRAALVTA